MTDNPYLLRLAAYRLEADLSFDELAAQMTAAGCPVRARSLHLALTNRLQTGPRERTLYKIAAFVDRVVGRPPRTRKPVKKVRRRLSGAAA